ncbi:hypothetical protein GCM10023310_04890 [Paenibacillus vulneris]|uniref:hypothetical protein n=1 Tax=Paenibacillus sp. 32352 TaxID=1969111 RepID=UPI0009ABAEC1|nr:hypothetical protein [Paenibacillus sp. 32352]
METANVFTNFRPIYLLLIIVLIVSVLVMLFQKKHYPLVNGFTISLILCICLIVSGFMTYQIGILSDALSMGGDPVSFIMFIIVAILSVISLLVYLGKSK